MVQCLIQTVALFISSEFLETRCEHYFARAILLNGDESRSHSCDGIKFYLAKFV